MNIKLSKPFAANSPADEFDTRQIKKVLNRLGYYQPYHKTGITGIPDADIFTALKAFQKDHALPPTGTLKPGDETVAKLNSEAANKNSGQYIWRSVEDDKVRSTHAALNGTIRNLADSPDPGEEFNCRCWADFSGFKGLNLEFTNCDKARKDFNDAQEKVKALSDQLNDLLLKIDALKDEANSLLQKARISIGTQAVSQLLSFPLDRIGFIGEAIREYFGNVFNNASMEAADKFMQEYHAVREKIKYYKNQYDIVFAQLQKAAKELELAKKKLEECEGTKEK